MNPPSAWVALWLLLSVSSVAGCATSAQAQQSAATGRTYRVRVHRPVAVGARFRVEGRGETRSRTETIDAFGRRIGGDEELASAEFAGDATVLALDSDGYVRSVSVVVGRAVADDGERNGPFITPGTTITITAGAGDAEPRVEREGRALDAFSMQFLTLAYDLRNLYGFRASMFGAGARRAVGERWPVPALQVITVSSSEATITRADGTQETVRLPARATENSSSAEATLARVSRVDGVSCLEVTTTMRADMRRPDGAMESSQSQEWTMLLPRARRRAPLGMSSRSTIDGWTTTAVDGRPVRSHLLGQRTTIVRFAELP